MEKPRDFKIKRELPQPFFRPLIEVDPEIDKVLDVYFSKRKVKYKKLLTRGKPLR